MSKKTKASKKRLNNLLLILLLMAVLLIMSTYAWFTANRTVNIDSIDVQVATSSGLQISADGINWRTVLSKTDIMDAHTKYENKTLLANQLPSIMAPVSSALELDDNGRIKMFYGDVEAVLDNTDANYGKYLLSTKLQTDKESSEVTADDITANEYAKGYYMAFDVYLKVEADSANLYMSGNVEETGTTEKGLANAARIALVKCVDDNVVTTDATTSNIQGISTAGGSVFMWEPNADSHTKNGVKNASDLGWSSSLVEGTGNAVLEYSGSKAEVADVELSRATAANYPNEFPVVKPNWSTEKGTTPSLELTGGLKAGISKVRLYFWIEGQDVDCENNASGTEVQFDLSFSLDPISGTTTTDPDDTTTDDTTDEETTTTP